MDTAARARQEVELLWRHREFLLRLLRRRLPRAPAADLLDLAHDVFVWSLESLVRSGSHIENPRAWLAVLATRAAIDYGRAKTGWNHADPATLLRQVAAEEDPDTRVTLLDLARRLDGDETLQTLLGHGPLDQLTVREIGRILGVGRGRKARLILMRAARSLADVTRVGGRWSRHRRENPAPPQKKLVPKDPAPPSPSIEPTPSKTSQGVAVEED